MHVITRKFEWDAAHKVLNHESKCKNMHGHRYVAEISVASSDLDSLGRVIDFSQIKDLFGNWIDSYWDHNTILNQADPLIDLPTETLRELMGRQPYLMAVNPTAENMVAELFAKLSPLLLELGQKTHYKLMITKIRLWETPNCSCTFENPYL